MLAAVQDAPRRLTPVTLRVILDRACACRVKRIQSGRRNSHTVEQRNMPGDQLSKNFQKQRTKLDRRGSFLDADRGSKFDAD